MGGRRKAPRLRRCPEVGRSRQEGRGNPEVLRGPALRLAAGRGRRGPLHPDPRGAGSRDPSRPGPDRATDGPREDRPGGLPTRVGRHHHRRADPSPKAAPGRGHHVQGRRGTGGAPAARRRPATPRRACRGRSTGAGPSGHGPSQGVRPARRQREVEGGVRRARTAGRRGEGLASGRRCHRAAPASLGGAPDPDFARRWPGFRGRGREAGG